MNFFDKLSAYISSDIHNYIQDIVRIAQKKNQKIVLVGGVVRDFLLGRTVHEADVMVEAPAQPLVDEMARLHPIKTISHERFLTHTLIFPQGEKIDIVTAREETYPAPAQLPRVSPSTIQKDLRRRDFTINSMAYWLTAGEYGKLLDPFFGQEDMQKKIIRALHARSFVDDPTRIYRAARFAGRLGFQVERETEGWIFQSVSEKIPGFLSPVRRRHEFELILKEENPAAALHLLEKWGALSYLHPEWTGVPPAVVPFLSRKPPAQSPLSLLLWRLVIWFKPWEREKALKIMTDLAFEKETKREVLDRL